MAEVKQIIIWRKDLRNTSGQKVRTGKIAGQVAHASLNSYMVASGDKHWRNICSHWMDTNYTKVVLCVNSLQELLDLHILVTTRKEMPSFLVQDIGNTEFGQIPTYTCMAIGPYFSEDIDKITGHLELL